MKIGKATQRKTKWKNTHGDVIISVGVFDDFKSQHTPRSPLLQRVVRKKMKNFDVFFKDEKTASVRIDGSTVYVTRYVIHPVKQIFAKDKLTKYELGEVLRLRCWEEKRDHIERYLSKLGLDEYDVYKICEKTHGVRLTDSIWFRFEGETITSKDVLVNS